MPEVQQLDLTNMVTLQPDALEALAAQAPDKAPNKSPTPPSKQPAADENDKASSAMPLAPLPSGFASVQPPVSLAPVQPPSSPPAMMPRSLLSEQLVSQFTMDLNRAFTLSFNMDNMEGAPSLGLNALIDMGVIGSTALL